MSEAVLQQLAKRKTLGPDDLVWSAGVDEWMPARTLPWLFPPSAEASVPPPPPFARGSGGDVRPSGEVHLQPFSAREGAADTNQSRSPAVESGSTPNAAGRAAWVLLIIAWVAFLIPVPGSGIFVGWPANFVAFVLAIVAIAQRGTKAGIFQLLSSLVVSPVVYLFGSIVFAMLFFSAGASVGA